MRTGLTVELQEDRSFVHYGNEPVCSSYQALLLGSTLSPHSIIITSLLSCFSPQNPSPKAHPTKRDASNDLVD